MIERLLPRPLLRAGSVLLALLAGLTCADAGSDTWTTQTHPAAEASQADPGIGGTGNQPGGEGEDEGNGIGGTGQTAGREPGIGGTGIIGTITGFGSIWVNGLEVDYDPALPVTSEGGRLKTDALRIGQVVEIEADGDGTRFRAKSIALRHEVAGPIEQIDTQSRTLVVLGQRVAVADGASEGGTGALDISELRVGEAIDVSGLRQSDGTIAASRIDRSAPGAAGVLRGTLTRIDGERFSVNGREVVIPPDARPASLAAGDEIEVIGTAADGAFRARRVLRGPAAPFGGRMRRLLIEGYVGAGADGEFYLGRTRLGPRRAGVQFGTGERVIIDGSLDGQRRLLPARVAPPRFQFRRDGRRGIGPRGGPFRPFPAERWERRFERHPDVVPGRGPFGGRGGRRR